MKKITLVGVLVVMIYSLFGQTQVELNAIAKSEYEQTDKELNQIYQKLLQDYKSDSAFINGMKEAQRQWVKFREAQVIMKYPHFENADESVLPMCRNYYLKELTTYRIKELTQWKDGVEEGDVCSGSIRLKQ